MVAYPSNRISNVMSGKRIVRGRVVSGDQTAVIIEPSMSSISFNCGPIRLTFKVVIVFKLVVVCRIFVAGGYVEGTRALSIGSVRFSTFAFELDALFGSVFQLMETSLTIGTTVAIDA